MDPILKELLADPEFVPPADIFIYDLSHIGTVMISANEPLVALKFLILETSRVLHYFETEFKSDRRPRQAVASAAVFLENVNAVGTGGLLNPDCTNLLTRANAAASAGRHALKFGGASASAAYAAADTCYAAYDLSAGGRMANVSGGASWALDYVRRADPKILLIDQYRRFLNLVREAE